MINGLYWLDTYDLISIYDYIFSIRVVYNYTILGNQPNREMTWIMKMSRIIEGEAENNL